VLSRRSIPGRPLLATWGGRRLFYVAHTTSQPARQSILKRACSGRGERLGGPQRLSVCQSLSQAQVASNLGHPRSKPQPPHPVTGLWKRCVLKCDWRVPIDAADIQYELGEVPPDDLEWAIAWIKADVERKKRELKS
jgi:hypothetical protein